jgi:hypothetical protein
VNKHYLIVTLKARRNTGIISKMYLNNVEKWKDSDAKINIPFIY